MNLLPVIPAVMAIVMIFCEAAPANAPIVREHGAIYLSDFGEKPLQAELRRPIPCFFDSSMQRYAGTLRFPQTVAVEAFAPNICRIRGEARQGGVAAWIPTSELDGLPEGIFAQLQKAEERRKTVESLIAQNEVAIGMTADEVLRSVGKPQKKSSRADAETTSEKWEYIKYDLIPQTLYGPSYVQKNIQFQGRNGAVKSINTGQTVFTGSTVLTKVPVGTLTISFEGGVVSSIEQSEGTLAERDISIVVPPVNVYY